MNFWALLVFGLMASADPPRKVAIYFGGGGEKSLPNNRFDRSFREFAKFAKDKKWETEIFYSRYHEGSQLAMKQEMGEFKPSFTQENFRLAMNGLISRLQDDKDFKKGDQILIQFDTHGTDNGKLALSSTDGEVYPEELLKEIKTLAESKGVRLAIVSNSCFSGRLQKISSSQVCVVSGSEEGALSAISEGTWFNHYLRSSDNLEKAYLRTRDPESLNVTDSTAQPMISSGPGRAAAEALAAIRHVLRFDVEYTTGSGSSDFGGWHRPIKCDLALTELMSRTDLFKLVGQRVLLDQIRNGSLLSRTIYSALRDSIKRIQSLEGQQLNAEMRALARLEREAYLKLYGLFSKGDVEPNPCRDFQL